MDTMKDTKMQPATDAVIEELLNRLEAAESECLEQARLNGMGGEREAALLAKLEAAEKDIAIKEEVIDSLAAVVKRLNAQCDAAEKERDVLNAKVERMEKRLRLILEEPENTMGNSKAMREMLKQARLALEGSK